MALSFQQTDTAAPCGTITACSGATVSTTTFARLAADGGTPGTAEILPELGNGETNVGALMFEIQPGQVDWPAGDYVVRINVTSGNANTTWTGTYVCRVNSSCVSQAEVGSLTGQSIALTTGQKVMTVAGAAQTNPDTDRIYIVCIFTNVAMGKQSTGITPSELIDTPLAEPPLGETAGIATLDYSALEPSAANTAEAETAGIATLDLAAFDASATFAVEAETAGIAEFEFAALGASAEIPVGGVEATATLATFDAAALPADAAVAVEAETAGIATYELAALEATAAIPIQQQYRARAIVWTRR